MAFIFCTLSVGWGQEQATPEVMPISPPLESSDKPAVVQANDSTTNNPTSAAPAKSFKRRVMLMVFINESRDKNKEYLSISVADAFSSPLVKTDNFIILNRDSVNRYMATMGIPHADIYAEANATRLGKAIGADVVVVGKFVNQGESVIVEAKAVDVQTGLVSVYDSEEIKTNASMFNSINHLAERMSGPMAEKMQPLPAPPPPAEVVLTEEQVVARVEKAEEKKTAESPPPTSRKIFITVHAGGAFAASLGYTRTIYPLGFGGMLGGEVLGLSSLFFRQKWLEDIELGIITGYLLYHSKTSPYENLTQIPLHASLGYRFNLSNCGCIAVTPLISGGLDFGNFSNVNGTALYRIFAWSAGGRAEYRISELWSVSHTILTFFELDQGTNWFLINFLSVGYKF